MESKRVQTLFFGALFLLLFLGVARLFAPFFSVLLWSSLLYILFSPLYHRILKRVDLSKRRGRAARNFLAGVFSVGSVVAIVVPLLFIAVQLGRQSSGLIRAALAYLERNPELASVKLGGAAELLREISFGGMDLSTVDVRALIAETLRGGSAAMVRFGTALAKNVGSFLTGLAFMTFTLFFFYIDGEYLLKLCVGAVPIRGEYAGRLVQKFKDTTRNLLFGYFLVSGVQALFAYVIFVVFSVDGALVFSILLFFCSFIPMIGAGAVWFPLGVARMLAGDVAGGLLFLVLCAFFVSTLDNFLRPLFLGNRISLHPLIIFFSILGGVSVFGFDGIVLGPMLVIFFLTVLDLFLAEHGIDAER